VKEPKPIVHPRHSLALNLAAVGLLALMAALMFSSAWNDTITFDEAPHIGAGYAYLRKSDFRFNPEHPPLMKDLGALPLLFMHLRVDWNHPSWTQDPYGQWDFGLLVIFHSGRDADTVTRAAKTPMILFTLALGGLLFSWTRRHFGGGAAALALFLYALSPTFLAHGRLVTTDVGAAAGFFVGTAGLLRFLKDQTWGNTLLAGLATGFAFLTKFSTIALVPVALILAVAWTLLEKRTGNEKRTGHRSLFRFRKRPSGRFVLAVRAPGWVHALLRTLARVVCIFAIAFAVVYVIYIPHMLRYPQERQQKDIEVALASDEVAPFPRRAVEWMSSHTLLRPWGEYSLGLAATNRRSDLGNNPFFFGSVRPKGSTLYFPFVYLVKEPLALHLLTLLALVFFLIRIRWRALREPGVGEFWRERCREWLRAHFTECAFLVVIGIYGWAAIRSNLNIGVRHILPIFPFIFILVANGIARLHRAISARPAALWTLRVAVGTLLCWQAISVIRVHPSYLAYFNELAGGPDGGWRYVTDSNIDWGQDLKRLAMFVESRGIQKIQLNYFGSAVPADYLDGRYQELSGCPKPTEAPLKGWVAVSAMSYPGAPWNPTCDYRHLLPMDKLVAKIGYSIFVFHMD
jgi:dolichyl-phosphate-mannose-protein mannosyltransferase